MTRPWERWFDLGSLSLSSDDTAGSRYPLVICSSSDHTPNELILPSLVRSQAAALFRFWSRISKLLQFSGLSHVRALLFLPPLVSIADLLFARRFNYRLDLSTASGTSREYDVRRRRGREGRYKMHDDRQNRREKESSAMSQPGALQCQPARRRVARAGGSRRRSRSVFLVLLQQGADNLPQSPS